MFEKVMLETVLAAVPTDPNVALYAEATSPLKFVFQTLPEPELLKTILLPVPDELKR